MLVHQPLFVAKRFLGQTFYFANRDTFEHWLEVEHPNHFIKQTDDEYKVFETLNFNTSSICTYHLTETSFVTLSTGDLL